jgi:predicted transcriptional regulator
MARRSRPDRWDGLGDLQLTVLDVLWQLEEATVYDVLEALPESGRPKYTTILTVLRSLEKRGLAAHTMRERTYVFRPAQSQAEVRRGLLRALLTRAFSGSPRRLVASLLETEDVTREELAELKALIADKEQEMEGEVRSQAR